NEVELRGVTRVDDVERAVRSLANGRMLTIAKLGKRGCLTVCGDRPIAQGPFPIDAVDTTGAGDTFNAGFLHGWLRKEPIEACMRWGAACGALSTLAPGIASQPSSKEVEEYLSRHA